MAIVTIGGNVGAGKTVLAARLAKALSYEELYMGKIFREMAAERGMRIEAFYEKLASDPTLERSTDERQKKMMREKDDLVVQGRMAWLFSKESPFPVFNVFLAVDPAIGAERSARRPEYRGVAAAEVARANALREATEKERYRALYGIANFLDFGHYDFVLDTSALSEEAVCEKVLAKIREHLEGDA